MTSGADGTRDDAGDEDGSEAAESPPTTDVEVEAHLHFGMTGSFPLRVADLFFADDGLYVVEYSYITPFVGLASRKHRREAAAMAEVYEKYGLDAVLMQGDSVVWHSYDNLDRVVVHEGGWIGRPKVTVRPRDGQSHAYRFHDRPDWAETLPAVERVADRHGVDLDRRSGLGFTPWKSVRRFFWKR